MLSMLLRVRLSSRKIHGQRHGILNRIPEAQSVRFQQTLLGICNRERQKGILYKGYTYRLTDNYKQSFRLQRTKIGCKASLSTVVEEQEVLKGVENHNHATVTEPERKMYTARISLKSKATEDPNERL